MWLSNASRAGTPGIRSCYAFAQSSFEKRPDYSCQNHQVRFILPFTISDYLLSTSEGPRSPQVSAPVHLPHSQTHTACLLRLEHITKPPHQL
ncbi:hypothetical protein BDZ91DRAFT_720835 [Kalaharituber pfeilii]|nr:hypothetical protein BDZ91DRAFT_720835 [Kalaharituber pfeilii]